jgi:lysophospholipase L1-like esterase
MKTVLCFGDSNTWGYDPDASLTSPFPVRHPHDVRWTGVLARELGAGWLVIEEGQNGRTTVFEDPLVPHRKGLDYLPAALESHKPLDAVVLMLGTNDLKAIFSAPATQIAEGAGVLAKMILTSDAGPDARAPKVLLVAPAAAGPFALLPELDEKFAGAEAKAKRFPMLYRRLADTLGCAFLNAQDHVQPSRTDGLHFDAASHLALGRAIEAAVTGLDGGVSA